MVYPGVYRVVYTGQGREVYMGRVAHPGYTRRRRNLGYSTPAEGGIWVILDPLLNPDLRRFMGKSAESGDSDVREDARAGVTRNPAFSAPIRLRPVYGSF